MLKVSHFLGQTEHGFGAIPLFGKADKELEKCASSGLLPEVVRYIDTLRPSQNSQYVLVNAMGAVEYFGSNINGDAFTIDSLIHKPDNWTGNPLVDKVLSKRWPYGFPTFYNAHPFAHHRNKDASRAFGNVELAVWNDNMKRVELVVRVDHDRCVKFGGQGVWDKLIAGMYPDVPMGTKVPFDTCSICLDWEMYREALATHDPKKFAHSGQAALYFHKQRLARGKQGIRGLSITRKDYCIHAKTQMSRILSDGRKVWVFNDHPRFFDISFVFIGADKTAKVMLFIFRDGKVQSVRPSAEIADNLGVHEDGEKTASVGDEILKAAFGKLAKPKRAAIEKDVVPSQFAGKAVPVMTKSEPDIPKETLDGMGRLPMDKVLSTTAGMGIVLKPKEFQRVSLVRLGKKNMADDLDRRGVVFSKSPCTDPMDMGVGSFMPSLMKILIPLMALRSALAPVVEQRVVILSGNPAGKVVPPKAEESELLDKIGAAYNGYRSQIIDMVAHAPELMALGGRDAELSKVASAEVEELFTPLSVAYLQNAYLDEFGVTDSVVVQLSGG